MGTSNRVRQDPYSPNVDFISAPKPMRGEWAIDLVRGKWRIYEDEGTGYSTTTGQIIYRGKVVKRYDPEAGANEGRIAQFNTKAEAEEYCRKWLFLPPIKTPGGRHGN